LQGNGASVPSYHSNCRSYTNRNPRWNEWGHELREGRDDGACGRELHLLLALSAVSAHAREDNANSMLAGGGGMEQVNTERRW